MLGWHITISRQADGGMSPAQADAVTSVDLAVWQSGLNGLEWINELVKQGTAIRLGGNGYTSAYTSEAQYVLPQIAGGPPEAPGVWVSGPQDTLTDRWLGKTTLDVEALRGCTPREWLLIVAWDES